MFLATFRSRAHKLRAWRFSLRLVLMINLIVAVLLAWKANEIHRRQAAIAVIRRAGGHVTFRSQTRRPSKGAVPWMPTWLLRMIEEDDEHTVVGVGFSQPIRDGRVLESLRCFDSLDFLSLDRTDVGDSALKHIASLGKLETLSLGFTAISDTGLEHLRALGRLQKIDLLGTHVGDSGVRHLAACPNLQDVNLSGTAVTDAGLAYLGGLAGLQRLEVERTEVNGSGLHGFKPRPKFLLWAPDSNIGPIEATELWRRFPKWRIVYGHGAGSGRDSSRRETAGVSGDRSGSSAQPRP